VSDPRVDYARTLLTEAREELGRADGKVSILLATVSVAASIVTGAIVAAHWNPDHLDVWARVLWWLGTAIAGFGIVVLASALAPRVRHHADDPVLLRYFGHAAGFGSPELLLVAVAKVADQQAARTADQLWVISRLVVIKYSRIRIALAAFAVASLLIIASASAA
jgi:Family of unknown function (DUF5706)